MGRIRQLILRKEKPPERAAFVKSNTNCIKIKKIFCAFD